MKLLIIFLFIVGVVFVEGRARTDTRSGMREALKDVLMKSLMDQKMFYLEDSDAIDDVVSNHDTQKKDSSKNSEQDNDLEVASDDDEEEKDENDHSPTLFDEEEDSDKDKEDFGSEGGDFGEGFEFFPRRRRQRNVNRWICHIIRRNRRLHHLAERFGCRLPNFIGFGEYEERYRQVGTTKVIATTKPATTTTPTTTTTTTTTTAKPKTTKPKTKKPKSYGKGDAEVRQLLDLLEDQFEKESMRERDAREDNGELESILRTLKDE